MKLKNEAIDEITYLLDEVKDIVRLLKEFGIHINSDCWSSTYPILDNEYEDILSWDRKNFETIDVSDIKSFYIGGNIITGSQHTYKDESILAPKDLAEVQGDIFKRYLVSIINSISLKYFKLKLDEPFGLIDNCGWEHYLIIKATIKESAKKDNTIEEYLKEIDEEWDDCDYIYKALSLVLATQEQDKWDDIYRYITNIINIMDYENGYSAKTIRDEINFRKKHSNENKWIDDLDDEKYLMCLDWHQYHIEEPPCFVSKKEIEQIFKREKEIGCKNEIKTNKLTENRYEVTFNGDLLYFVCPLNAKEEVKKDWKELKYLFKKYE